MAPSDKIQRVGRYLVGPRVGTGGMAVVHAAYEPMAGGDGRLVAIKRVSSAHAGDLSARRLFLREASIVTRIEHPNVVRTYEVGHANGETYIAMELLEGATLAELQRAAPGRIPLPIALHIIAGALRGLHAAHELCASSGQRLGLVHQDVSPQNVHVAFEGTTRILDFGVARLTALEGSRTETIRGKSCYLAPEQLELGKITRQTDLFAAGIVLHELLTGAPLFPRTHADSAYSAILSGKIPGPRDVCTDVPEAIDAVARRALAWAATARFESAEQMRQALISAQERERVRTVDVAAVGAWVRQRASSSWNRADLERDLGGPATSMDLAADLQTLPPRREHGKRGVTRVGATRQRAFAFAATVALAATVLLVLHEVFFPRAKLPEPRSVAAASRLAPAGPVADAPVPAPVDLRSAPAEQPVTATAREPVRRRDRSKQVPSGEGVPKPTAPSSTDPLATQ